MKKWVIFLMFIMTIQIGYRITPVLAETDEAAIKKVIENYLEGVAKRDYDLVMNQISTSFSSRDKKGQVVYYAEFKTKLEEILENIANISITDAKITNLDAQDNKATLEMEYNLKGFSLDIAGDVSVKHKRIVSLVKEDGSWKIVQVETSPVEDQKPGLESESTKSKP